MDLMMGLIVQRRIALNSEPPQRFLRQQAEAEKAAKEAKAAAQLASQQEAAAALGYDPRALARLVNFDSDHFFKPEALLSSVESGAVAALKGSYLVKLAKEGGRWKRRQDMPPEAFWNAAELRATAEALGPASGLLFVVLSYRWLTKVRGEAREVSG